MSIEVGDDFIQKKAKQIKSGGPLHLGSDDEIGDTYEVYYKTNIEKTEPGDEDLLGNIWEQDWEKFEAKADIDYGEGSQDKILSLGGMFESSYGGEPRPNGYFSDWIDVWSEYLEEPGNIKGTRWKVEMIDDWEWDITYLGSDFSEEESNKAEELVKEAYSNIDDKVNSSDVDTIAQAVLMNKMSDFADLGINDKDEIKEILQDIDEV